jgi:hypothetical protein
MTAILTLTVLFTLIILSLIGYRCWLHPLSHIPGPFLASVTGLYKTYWNFQPDFALNFAQLHDRYGKPTHTGTGGCPPLTQGPFLPLVRT